MDDVANVEAAHVGDRCEHHKALQSCGRNWCRSYLQVPNLTNEGGEIVRLKAKLCGFCVRYTGGVYWTLQEIGLIEGVSRERIRQVEELAIKKLKVKAKNFTKEYVAYKETKAGVEEETILQVQIEETKDHGYQIE